MASDNCTLLVSVPEKVALPSQAELQAELQSSDVNRKISALKKAIMLLLSGDDAPRTLMTVIQYCINVENHTLQKLLMLYWEVARKYDAAGKLLPEMILVCNALRNNLIHPNEYIRGSTLRFLCKLREPELLEPLVSSIKTCLSHRHPYVRRNAVLAVHTVFKHFPDLYPDAPDDIEKLLEDETDSNTRRNAFTMIFSCAQDKALTFLSKNLERVLNFGDGFSLILLDLIRKVGRADPGKKAKFIRIVFSLLDSPSSAVSFEAAGTLTSLSAAPSAVRAAASAYIKILNKESDNNVKLIVLERLNALRKRHAKTLRELVMDILRALSTPNTDIRKKCLDIAMDLVYPRNVEEVMGVLKKEIISTSAGVSAKAGTTIDPEDVKYRNMLIGAMHGCAVRFPDVASNVVHLLMDFLNGEGALIVVEFVREIVETYPDMRKSVIAKLRDVMPDMQASDVYRVALWLLGQYSETDEEVHAALHTIRECIGPLPLITPYPEFVAARAGAASGAAEAIAPEPTAPVKRPVVLADGTYATQSAVTMPEASTSRADDDDSVLPVLRKLLLAGDFFLGAVVSATLSKLALRVAEHHSRESRQTKAAIVDAMLVMCAIIELGASGLAGTATLLPANALPSTTRRGGSGSSAGSAHTGQRIDQDSFERIVMCMRVLGDPTSTAAALPVLLHTCRDTFRSLLADRRTRAAQAAKDGVVTGGGAFAGLNTAAVAAAAAAASESKGAATSVATSADDCLNIRLLRPNRGLAADEAVFDDDADISKATALTVESFSERLKRVHQLTGFADPVYCEAYMRVHEYDIVLELSVINRTSTTLTNVMVELATMGELRLVDRPQPFTLGPKDSRVIKANIKVSSTETGHIFGTIVYDTSSSGSNPVVVNLADLHVDIMDYIQPAICSDSAFRSMWADFEWENKVAVSTNITDLQAFVAHIAKMTNMRVLTPITTLSGCNFLAANLYARSTFGEDALVNVSIENKADGSIRGHIRIRAKTQGVALSLGDRITSKQKA